MLRIIVIIIIIFSLGCARNRADPTKDWDAAQLYNAATESISNADFEQAIKYYESLRARYPFSVQAKQAELDIAYAYYKFGEPESALNSIERYIREHPNGPALDYALYLQGLIYTSQVTGNLLFVFPKDAAEFDQTFLKNAFASFDQVIQRFPDSKYTEDAGERLVFIRNKMAEHELSIAEYYYKRGAYVAVINRAQHLLENYQGAPSMPNALILMIKGYQALGMEDLAQDTYRILQLNYPDHPAVSEIQP